MFSRSPVDVYADTMPDYYYNGGSDNISTANTSRSNKEYPNHGGLYPHDHRLNMEGRPHSKRNIYGDRYLESGASKSRPSYTETASETDASGKLPRSYNRVAVRFADRTSVQGIPYINISKTWYAKAAWTLFFLCATGGMIYHLYYLFSIYLKFEVKTNVNLGFDTLPFPAVTVCNVNPVMKSKLRMVSQELRDIVDEVDPKKVIDLYKPPPPGPPGRPPGPPDDIQGQSDDDSPSQSNTQTNSAQKNTTPDNDPQNDDPQNGSNNQTNTSDRGLRSRQKRFLDKIPNRHRPPKRVEVEQRYFDAKDWESVGDYDNTDMVYDEFISIYNTLTRRERFELGHKMKNMLIKCSFSGLSCYADNFTRVSDPHLGNCFTLESELFKSRRSGPGFGLELLLFLENHEYIRGISNSNGAQVLVHDRGAYPQPSADGFAISAGAETFIGVKLIRISRMGDPFGKCNSTQSFQDRYGMKYTRSACQELCEAEMTMEKCQCSDTRREEITLKIAKFRPIPNRCASEEEILCEISVAKQFEKNLLQCDCQDPCQEMQYVKSISSRQWPSDDYAAMLFQVLCRNKGEEVCEEFEQTDKRTLSQNFVKVNIYYEDLNYQNITETQDYEFAQFISDVGGTLGLWIGLSVLSVVEVIQFIVELFHHMCCVSADRKSTIPAKRP